MSLFFILIYCGGIAAYPHRKIGWINRLMWPHDLGEKLAEYAWRDTP